MALSLFSLEKQTIEGVVSSNIEVMQISKILSTALNYNNNTNIININSISKEKNKINKIYYSETDYGSNNNNKEYLTVNIVGNNKIINKIKEINFKIYRKATPEKRKTYTSFGSKFLKIKKVKQWIINI